MQITDVRIRCLETEGKLKALASVVFDGAFVIHDIRIIEGTNGLFVSMPRKKSTGGEYKDVAHPITSEARELVHKSILEAFHQTTLVEAGT